MDIKEKLNSLKEQIRKDIPRLNELSVGCLIKDKKYGIVYKVYNETAHHLRVFELNSELPNTLAINKKHIDSFEIVGHEIMLNDVLEWLKKIEREVWFYSFDYAYFEIINADLSYSKEYWDLSKPLIDDQSKETIEFLYNLRIQ